MIRSLQVGRGLAALAVTAFHLSYMFGDQKYAGRPVFDTITARGNLGVDFFFVLSGFIITMAHQRDIGRPEQARDFVVKRFIRVYPLYWIFTALIFVGSAATGGANTMPHAFGDIASMVALVHFTPYDVPLGPAWTLFFETLFYALFATLILNRRLGIALFTAWFALLLVSFQRPAHGSWTFWTTLTSTSNLNFLGGIAAYFVAQRIAGARALAVLVGGTVSLPLIFLCEDVLGRGAMLHVLYGLAFTAMIAGAVGLERERRMPHVPALELLGSASYTLYLSHESVGSTLLKIAAKLRLTRMVNPHLLYPFVLAAMIAFAIIFYLLVEKPMLAALRRVFETRRFAPDAGPLPT